MISIIEIKNTNRETIGIIDTAKSVIWHRKYYGVGDFEIYMQANDTSLSLLQVNNYVTRPDDDEIGIIENIAFDFTPQSGYMITAIGRFAKSILDRRVIYKLKSSNSQYGIWYENYPTIISGSVELSARTLVYYNAISSIDTRRNISILGLAALNNLTPRIVDGNGNAAKKQVTHDNLLEYTDNLLQEYGLSAKIIFNRSNKKLLYSVFQGADRSTDNTQGNSPIIFSVDYDNLNSANYQYDETALKNTALIGGAGEGIERAYSLLTNNKTGLELREIFVDAQSQSKVIKESELLQAYPNGNWALTDEYYYIADGKIIAVMLMDLTKEYTLSTLQNKFPSGTVSGTKFVVGGVTFATAVYAKENTYNLTQTGYLQLAAVDNIDSDCEYIPSVYRELLDQQGQTKLKETIVTENFDGNLNVQYGQWKLNRDFFLGDIVTVQDNKINKYANARITETTEVQDENGYSVEVVFSESIIKPVYKNNYLLTEDKNIITTENDEKLILDERG